ncbi:mycofactocin precursor MftA [Nocardia sp. CA-107356]
MRQVHTEPTATHTDDDTVEADLLVEDVSIDGMCGVY